MPETAAWQSDTKRTFDSCDHEEGFVMLEPTSQKERIDDGKKGSSKPNDKGMTQSLQLAARKVKVDW